MQAAPQLEVMFLGDRMEIFAEVDIRSQNGTEYIDKALQDICEKSKEWIYNIEKSNNYKKNILQEFGCIITNSDSTISIAICEEKNGHCKIANITPTSSGEITRAKYNEIAFKITSDFRKLINKSSLKLVFTIKSTELNLKNIISSSIARKCFENFLNNFPLSTHPNDRERLDKFTSAVARYSRKNINFEYLHEYLTKKMNFPTKSADTIIERIEIGLDVISVYRKFY